MNLLKEMEQLVEKHVKHYKTDFSVHDVEKLKLHAKRGTKFYWLLRDCGTWLEREDELLVDSDEWNKLSFFTNYLDSIQSCKLFLVTTTSKPGEPLEGTVEALPFPAYLDNFKKRQTPKQYNIEYKDNQFTRMWDSLNPPTGRDIQKFLEEQHLTDINFGEVVVRFVF